MDAANYRRWYILLQICFIIAVFSFTFDLYFYGNNNSIVWIIIPLMVLTGIFWIMGTIRIKILMNKKEEN